MIIKYEKFCNYDIQKVEIMLKYHEKCIRNFVLHVYFSSETVKLLLNSF